MEPVRILTVCTHNRTRSVMAMGLLQASFDRTLGTGSVLVRSLGFGPEDIPAFGDAIDAMARRGIDVSEHRSRRVTRERIDPADLILTAERDHVVRVANESQRAYRRAFTLPEFLDRAAAPGVVGDVTDVVEEGGGEMGLLAAWVQHLAKNRTVAGYLGTAVPEIADPTGSSQRRFEAATVEIERMCDAAVDLISSALAR